jgi:hypothetical protein
MVLITKDVGNYVIYSDGRIWSKYKKKFMSPFVTKRGYSYILLNGKNRRLHRVIAECFIDNPENHPEVDHIDGNKQNNSVLNLRWVNREQNMDHAVESGFLVKGEDVHCSKLTKEDIIEIYTNPNKLSARQLSKKFNVYSSTISQIQSDKGWKHVTKNLLPGCRFKSGGYLNRKIDRKDIEEIFTNPDNKSTTEFSIKFNKSVSIISRIQRGEIYREFTENLTPGHRNKRGRQRKS